MRIAADGTAVDTTPLPVPGRHIRAHIASSGSEFLLALDSLSDVSIATVRTGSGAIQLSDEVSLFHWFTGPAGPSSDVVWDGVSYVTAWRFSSLDSSWVAATRVSRSGQASSPTIHAGGSHDPRPDYSYAAWEASFAAAASDAGRVAFIVSEGGPSAADMHARIYYLPELAPMPAAPPSPRNVISYSSGNMARIDWETDDDPAGFLVERSFDSGTTWLVDSTAAGTARSVTAKLYTTSGNLFRVSALGAGGLSHGVVAAMGPPKRRRAAR
ncbi:MAG TPA: hypothetical protein VGQ46_05950 [Thermoanaerobaculia bacterium]|nr:hypothetical protein [Thermoanaerobaculia bacterium]